MSAVRTIADYVRLVNEADLVPPPSPLVALDELVIAVQNERNARSRFEVDPHAGITFVGATVRLGAAMGRAQQALGTAHRQLANERRRT